MELNEETTSEHKKTSRDGFRTRISPAKEKTPRSDERLQGNELVYLIRSGKFYKIGHTNSVGRREYELALQLPQEVQVLHKIETDDPEGIEALLAPSIRPQTRTRRVVQPGASRHRGVQAPEVPVDDYSIPLSSQGNSCAIRSLTNSSSVYELPGRRRESPFGWARTFRK